MIPGCFSSWLINVRVCVWEGENFHPDSWDRMPADRLFVVILDEAESGHTSWEGSLPQGFEQAIQTRNKCNRATFTCNLLVNNKIDDSRPLVGGFDPTHHGVRSSFVIYTCGWKKEQRKFASDELAYHPVLVFIFLLYSTDRWSLSKIHCHSWLCSTAVFLVTSKKVESFGVCQFCSVRVKKCRLIISFPNLTPCGLVDIYRPCRGVFPQSSG